MRITLVWVALATLGFVSGQDTRCPIPNVHCDCTELSSGIVTCTDLSEAPRSLPNETTFLDLSNNFLGPVLIKSQMDPLGSLGLLQLYLTNNGLEIIEDRAFEMLYTLIELDISSNDIQALAPTTFDGLKNLQYLYANDAGIVVLPDLIFSFVPTLTYIDLEDNRLTSVGREFTYLPDLAKLYLAENQISQIAREAFAGLSDLQTLSLFGNQLNRPISSWFRELVSNNGTIDLDRRADNSIIEPNPWLCCPDVSLYHNYLLTLPRNLKSYYQLDVICSWPVAISGRLLSTLSMAELNAVPCANYTTTTVEPDWTTTVTTEEIPSVPEVQINFLGSLNDAGAFFILLLVAAISGLLVGGLCICCRTKKGKQKWHDFVNVFRPSNFGKSPEREGSEKSTKELTTRPYRQDSPSYGSTAPASRQTNGSSIKPARPAPPVPPNGDGGYTSVVKPVDMTYSNYTMETDQSEDEVWSRTERKNPV